MRTREKGGETMKPFVKWPGGKSEELSIINAAVPNDIENYIEPFLGGGACFLALDINTYHKAYVNDLSDELIELYLMIREQNAVFYRCLQDIWAYWSSLSKVADNIYEEINHIYNEYKASVMDNVMLKEKVARLVENKIDVLMDDDIDIINIDRKRLIEEYKKTISSKLKNIKKKEDKDGSLPIEDYADNFEAGVRAAVYTYYRHIYNNTVKYKVKKELHIALFFYLREFCYSSMFRYNKSGGFNVPYGGLSYNNKNFGAKIKYIQEVELNKILKNAKFYKKDFEDFFNELEMNERDFMFLDPPYDGGFSDYANNTFDQQDQIRLANYLINRCNCRFMLVIKNTNFIASLYENNDNINIKGFDKDYKVSFMDRNDKKVEHLIITNY